MSRKRYKTIGVPMEIVKRVEKYLDREEYASLSELVRELLRKWFREQEEKNWGQRLDQHT